jgi:hypothetical protein
VVIDQPARKLIKIRTKVLSHERYVTFHMAEVAVSRRMFSDILCLIARLHTPPAPRMGRGASGAASDNGRGMPRWRQSRGFSAPVLSTTRCARFAGAWLDLPLPSTFKGANLGTKLRGIWRNVGSKGRS